MAIKFDYLDSLKSYLRINSAIEDDVVQELCTHIEDKSEEFMDSGLSADEAIRTAIQSLGSPKLVAKQMYEVYSQGSWKQTLFAALPHLLVALFFTMHWWHITAWLSPMLLIVIGIAIYGWTHDKPAWLFPWLGYCLVPVIIIGMLFINLPGGWAWIAAIAYIPLALCILFPVAKKTIERDWLFASLMLLPIPVVLGWRLALGIEDMQQWLARICDTAQPIALSFAVLALTVATFIRVRQRWAKTGALLIAETIPLVVVASSDKNAVGLCTWIFLILLFLFIIISPALLDPVLRRSSGKELSHTAHKITR